MKFQKFVVHYNTPKKQEAVLPYRRHCVSKVPKTNLRFSCSLERFTELRKAVILMIMVY